MFNTKLKEEIKELKSQNDSLKDTLMNLDGLIEKRFKEKYSLKEKELELDMRYQRERLSAQEASHHADIKLKMQSAKLELQLENNKLQAKVDILEQAFNNLGFDVKDMKDILNKLVDGIIAKSDINIIK